MPEIPASGEHHRGIDSGFGVHVDISGRTISELRPPWLDAFQLRAHYDRRGWMLSSFERRRGWMLSSFERTHYETAVAGCFPPASSALRPPGLDAFQLRAKTTSLGPVRHGKITRTVHYPSSRFSRAGRARDSLPRASSLISPAAL